MPKHVPAKVRYLVCVISLFSRAMSGGGRYFHKAPGKGQMDGKRRNSSIHSGNTQPGVRVYVSETGLVIDSFRPVFILVSCGALQTAAQRRWKEQWDLTKCLCLTLLRWFDRGRKDFSKLCASCSGWSSKWNVSTLVAPLGPRDKTQADRDNNPAWMRKMVLEMTQLISGHLRSDGRWKKKTSRWEKRGSNVATELQCHVAVTSLQLQTGESRRV